MFKCFRSKVHKSKLVCKRYTAHQENGTDHERLQYANRYYQTSSTGKMDAFHQF